MQPHRTAAACLLLAASALLLAGAASASPEPGFTVDGARSFEHTSLAVQGAIVVASGGELTLDGVDLLITSAPGEPASLVVEQGGSLIVRGSTLHSDGAGFLFEIRGSASLRSSSVLGVASAPGVPVGRDLAGGYRMPGGGVRLLSSDVVFDGVRVAGASGCGISIEAASPTLTDVTVSQVTYRVAGSTGYASALCISGGSPRVEGLTLVDIGSGVAGSATQLRAAGILADGPASLALRDLHATGFVPLLTGQSAPLSVAVLIRDSSSVLISGGTIEGTTDGIMMRGVGSAAGTTTIEALSINVASGPISIVQAYSSDPQIVENDLQITGCSASNGLYVESQNSGAAVAVTVTVSNVTARSCGGAGINLFNNGALGAHSFSVFDCNASQNNQQGFYLHGASMGAGLAVLMSNNAAWRNNYAGFVIEATYLTTPAAKLASAKLENNRAENNSATASSWNGGFILRLGAPTTMSMNYVNNVATGNAEAGNVDYGHYMEVAVTQTLTIPYGFFSGIVARDNGEYGWYIGGGTAQFSRFDKARIKDSLITGHTTLGILGYYARIEVWNSTMSNSKEVEGTNTPFFLMGTVHTRLSGTTSGLFKIVSYKQVCLHGEWQNGAPLFFIPLTFTNGNNSAAAMYSDVSVDPPTAAAGRSTDANGNWSGWTIDWTYDPQAPSAQQVVDYAPFTISVQIFQTAATVGPFDLINNVCGPQQFVDPNPPDITISAPTENGTYTVSNLTVQGIVSDDLSGLAGLQLSVDGTSWTNLPANPGSFRYTFGNLTDGVYDLRIRAWDRANEGLDPRNETLVTLFTITIDTVAPALRLDDPPLQDGGEFWTAQNQIRFLGSVDQSVVTLFINGKAINITGTAFVEIGELPNEGPQSFLFLAIDAAGNAKTVKVTIYRDQVVPTLIITKPAARGEIYISAHTIEVEGITDPYVIVTINGVMATMLGTGTTFHADLTLIEGRNVINITAVDAAGNRAARAIGVTADTVAPDILLDSHQTGMFLNASGQHFVGTLTEPVPLFEINLRIFPVIGTAFDALLGLAEGTNLISINATDLAGNVGHKTITVTVDTVAPEVLLIGLPDFAVRNSAALNLAGSLSEPAQVRVEGLDTDVVDLQFDTSVTLVEGLNTIDITATDAAGNRAVLVRRVTLDTSQPSIQITNPPAGVAVHDATVNIIGVSEPNALIQVGNQMVVADETGKFSAWVRLDGTGTQQVSITVTDAAGNSVQQSVSVDYEAKVVDTGGDTMLGLAMLAGLGATLAVLSMLIAKRRVDGQLTEARGKRAAQDQASMGTPGYTEAPQVEAAYDAQAQGTDGSYYAQAPEGSYYAQAPEGSYYAQPEGAPPAEAPAPEAPAPEGPAPDAPPAPASPRAPRPPRPPSN